MLSEMMKFDGKMLGSLTCFMRCGYFYAALVVFKYFAYNFGSCSVDVKTFGL